MEIDCALAHNRFAINDDTSEMCSFKFDNISRELQLQPISPLQNVISSDYAMQCTFALLLRVPRTFPEELLPIFRCSPFAITSLCAS